MAKPFYITTAIDYPNGKPHIGHAYEKIVTDFYARWRRLQGDQVHFLTGTDENGQKLIQSAQEAGKETQTFVDENAQIFREFCDKLNITHDDFIRTTEDRHKACAQKIWKTLLEKELVYFDHYSGQYCYGCETFYTETQAPDGQCPEHHKPLEEKNEEGFFFKLSNYTDWLLEHIEKNPEFIQPSRARKEILGRLKKEGLKDLAISRPNEKWGIEVPDNDKFVMYTWFDALINYYSALDSQEKLDKFWPAAVHVIGKDITWFHTVIWPCVLQAAGIELPHQVYVHGMVLAEDGKKMSKSLGNVIDPNEMLEKYPLDTFRYYILRAISGHADGAFSEQELRDRHNSELGNDFGNLIMRVIKLSRKKIGDEVSGEGCKQELDFSPLMENFSNAAQQFEHHKALDLLWERIRSVNAYINDSEPWKVKDNPDRVREILYNCLYAIHTCTYFLTPAMPGIAKTVYSYLGVPEATHPLNNFGETTYHCQEPDILFVKFE
jgi:methionyl-tRNA synthetase